MKAINWSNVKPARDEVRAAGLGRNVTDHKAAAEAVARDMVAWPGCYDLVAVTDDGACLCADCVRSNFRQVYTATDGDGWKIAGVGCATGADDDSGNVQLDYEAACDHCGRNLGELF